MRRPNLATAIAVTTILGLAVSSVPAVSGPGRPSADLGALGDAPPSTFIGTARIDEAQEIETASDGDLWPTCWADDGNLYSANGDGKGFSLEGEFSDIAVNRIEGELDSLTGETVARGDDIGTIWNGEGYNRKPTGMVCVGNTLYLAVQDLALDFNDAPSATIAKSRDGGRTWQWDERKPMFDDGVFTTVWFADVGRGGPDGKWVYAYALDGNWRDSFDDTVADPEDLFLARVPRTKVDDRRSWEFYTGDGRSSRATWSRNIDKRRPVLHDGRRIYQQTYDTNHIGDMTVLGQGGVTWVPGLQRYLYASWTEYTFELYESPTPWGEWKRFATKDFGGYPWDQTQYAGYATTMPSKFLSDDGRTVYIQSNVCPCGGGGADVYHFSLRRMDLVPSSDEDADNAPDGSILTAPGSDSVTISKSTTDGRLDLINDGDPATFEIDSDDEVKSRSWWGYEWPREKLVNRVDVTMGEMTDEGGWFAGRPLVEVRRDGVWHRVSAPDVTPVYPGDASAAGATYTLTFSPAVADGVRIIGTPGGTRTYTSVAELSARYATQVADPGFEAAAGGPAAWDFEGTANHGVDRDLGFARTGRNNGWIRTSGTGWSASTQRVPVEAGRTYTFTGWTRTSPNLTGGRFGVRVGEDGSEVLGEQPITATAEYVQRQVTVTIPEGVSEVTLYAGFTAAGQDAFVQLDDFGVEPAP